MTSDTLQHPAHRAAIIGCGRIGTDTGEPGTGSSRIRSHAAAYTDSQRTELVALCDTDAGRLALAAERWPGAACYSSVDDLLTHEHPDLVSICTSPGSHCDVLGEVLRAEVPGVLLEKPIAAQLEDAERALGIAADSGSRIAVNYIRRFPPVYRQAIRDVAGGVLGTVQHVGVLYTKGIVNNGSHVLDLLRALFGDPVGAEVIGAWPAAEVDPTLSAQVRFADGVEASVRGLSGDAYNIFDIDILGTEGRLLFTDLGHTLCRYTTEDTRPVHGFRQLQPEPDVMQTELASAVRFAVEDLVQSVETGTAPQCTLEDGYAALELAWGLAGRTVAGREAI
jgi:predicted dehydrogenase